MTILLCWIMMLSPSYFSMKIGYAADLKYSSLSPTHLLIKSLKYSQIYAPLCGLFSNIKVTDNFNQNQDNIPIFQSQNSQIHSACSILNHLPQHLTMHKILSHQHCMFLYNLKWRKTPILICLKTWTVTLTHKISHIIWLMSFPEYETLAFSFSHFNLGLS